MSLEPPPSPPPLTAAGRTEGEARFEHLMDHAPVLVWAAGPDGEATYFNRPWLAFRGRSLAEERGAGWREGLHPDAQAAHRALFDQLFAARAPFREEYQLRRHDGEYRWVLDQGMPRFNDAGAFEGFIGSCTDISDLKAAETRRARDLAEKSALLEELHHRVRNNAQLFASLLTMQASRSAAPAVRRALAAAAARAATLAVAQDQMHAIEDPNSFDLHNYVYMLTQAAGPLTPANMRIVVESDERVSVPLSTVVPIGLIVHELITNAMRHAFPDGRRGLLRVQIRRTSSGGIAVIVADNGVGLPERFDFSRYTSVGATIIRRLAAQLQASVLAGPALAPDHAAEANAPALLPGETAPGAMFRVELPPALLVPQRAPRPATVSAFAR